MEGRMAPRVRAEDVALPAGSRREFSQHRLVKRRGRQPVRWRVSL